MSATLSWHPMNYNTFDATDGDSDGTVAEVLRRVFGDFPIDLSLEKHGEIIGTMVLMQEGDNTIYHQINRALNAHGDITIKVSY